MEKLSKRVRRLRIARGLSQEAQARNADVSKTHVYMVEGGRSPSPRAETLLRYAKVLGVSLGYLKYGYDDDPPEGREEWPSLEVCLRHTSSLTPEDIAQVARMVRALEADSQREVSLAAETYDGT